MQSIATPNASFHCGTFAIHKQEEYIILIVDGDPKDEGNICGVVVHDVEDGDHGIGWYSNAWDPNEFTRWQGEILLSD